MMPIEEPTASKAQDAVELSGTAQAPTYRQPLNNPASAAFASWQPFPPGTRIDDFEILRLLGSGSFASVYLAQQMSLDRHVALKISANAGGEARTLAHLEHDHIVQVFAEIVDASRNLRILCMQFVPGLTLDRVIDEMRQQDSTCWNGRTFLEVLDRLCTEPTAFDLSGLDNRSFLQSCDHAEVVCWIGACLADALAHAHSQGVIHRDIKPANILVNRYGRPFLADFNVALNSAQTCSGQNEVFGGTLGFMSPEHLDAFNPATSTAPQVVDARSDIYSLGVVLFVFLTGQSPFKHKAPGKTAAALAVMAAERRTGAPAPTLVRPDVPELLDRLIRRCLDPLPARRFQSAAELSSSLEGFRKLWQLDKGPQPRNWLIRCCKQRPFTMLLILALIPHLLGSAVNITYNNLHILSELSETQRAGFYQVVLVYNAVVYPLIVVAGVVLVRRVLHGCRRLRQELDLSAATATQIRRSALGLPMKAVILSALGWFSGGVIFPFALEWLAGPVTLKHTSIYLLFPVSFTLSGLIALTYAYFGVQFIVLRALYPRLWSDPAEAHQQAQKELPPVAGRLRFFQFLAGLIPVGGAGLLIFAAPDRLTVSYRFLLLGLLVLGLAGFGLAAMVSHRLEEVILNLRGRRDRIEPTRVL